MNTQPTVLETVALPIELYPQNGDACGARTRITSLRGWRPDRLDEGTMEIRAGLEPVIATVKGLCPNHLDERTICREHKSLLSGNRVINHQNVIYWNMQHCRKTNQIIKVGSAVPFCHL